MRKHGAIIPLSAKPRLWLANGIWVCMSIRRGVIHQGDGPSPASAYVQWKWAL